MSDDDGWHEGAYEAERAAIRRALELAGPWPAPTTSRTENVEVLDVDRYKGFAVVLAAVERPAPGHGLALQISVFRRDDGWQLVCGSGGGGSHDDPLLERRRWAGTISGIDRRGGGRCRPMPNQQGSTVCYAELFCGPAVATVVVDRPADRRFADVREGSGWIAIVWPEGSEPRVTALGIAGEELDHLDPGLFRDV